MKLAQISKADSFGGGASRVAEDLTYLINKNGFSAHHLCSWSGKGFHAQENRYPLYGRFEREIRFLHSKLKRYSPPELIPFEYIPLIRKIKREDYNLLHFHDLSSAISPYTLYLLGDKIPIVWTLHDCSPFTGGCLYPMECKNFMENCMKPRSFIDAEKCETYFTIRALLSNVMIERCRQKGGFTQTER